LQKKNKLEACTDHLFALLEQIKVIFQKYDSLPKDIIIGKDDANPNIVLNDNNNFQEQVITE
jgi:hypothetical protein